jgi:hypothetical protein
MLGWECRKHSHPQSTQALSPQIPIVHEEAATVSERPCYEGKALRHQYQAIMTQWQRIGPGNGAVAREKEMTVIDHESKGDDHDRTEMILERRAELQRTLA